MWMVLKARMLYFYLSSLTLLVTSFVVNVASKVGLPVESNVKSRQSAGLLITSGVFDPLGTMESPGGGFKVFLGGTLSTTVLRHYHLSEISSKQQAPTRD